MASLSQTAIRARKAIRYGIYILIVLIVARSAIKTGIAVFRALFPPPSPKPTVVFGKLPPIPFPEKEPPSDLAYTLETVQGKLPTFPEQMEVYYMPPIASNINALEAARANASKLGFSSSETSIVEKVKNVYLFQKPKPPSTLTMNIITGIFSISYDINSYPYVLDGLPPTPEEAVLKARSFLASAGYLPDDLEEGPATHELLRVKEGKIMPAISLSDANITKVNIFRNNVGKNSEFLSVTPDMPEANVWFMFAGQKGEIIAAEYHHFPMSKDQSGTYPIKTAEEAWEELKSGKAYIANPGENGSKQITIRGSYLAYYDAGLYTKFYQPVVVFWGDNKFIAFVPAITDEYY
jgi:hypothetical protein